MSHTSLWTSDSLLIEVLQGKHPSSEIQNFLTTDMTPQVIHTQPHSTDHSQNASTLKTLYKINFRLYVQDVGET